MQQASEPVPLPDELKLVKRAVLEDYVQKRLRHVFSSPVFATNLESLGVNLASVFSAYHNSSACLGSVVREEAESFALRFRHRCRHLGCVMSECLLCKNNPKKRCQEGDNFDECYADNQVLRSKCEADVVIEVFSSSTGCLYSGDGIEIQVSVVDGESWNETMPTSFTHVRELLQSDEGRVLLGSQSPGTRPDPSGHIRLKLKGGSVNLPSVVITDKNDTFHVHGNSYSTFRLMARCIRRDSYGNPVPVDSILPCISRKFIIKTQRALNDYRKSEYPHYKDELTRLKFIGNITAQRLKDIQTHLGFDIPFTCIETVEQLKHLMMYADQNRQLESKMLELLNMKGKHKHKWDYLRQILSDKIVYDDMTYRIWFTDESQTQGLMYAAKQAQITLEKPVGVVRRILSPASNTSLQAVCTLDAMAAEQVRGWKDAAEQAWSNPRHPGWVLANERMEVVSAHGASTILPGTQVLATGPGPLSSSMSGQDFMEESQGAPQPGGQSVVPSYQRNSAVSSPHAHSGPVSSEARRHSGVAMPMNSEVISMGPGQQHGGSQANVDFNFQGFSGSGLGLAHAMLSQQQQQEQQQLQQHLQLQQQQLQQQQQHLQQQHQQPGLALSASMSLEQTQQPSSLLFSQQQQASGCEQQRRLGRMASVATEAAASPFCIEPDGTSRMHSRTQQQRSWDSSTRDEMALPTTGWPHGAQLPGNQSSGGNFSLSTSGRLRRMSADAVGLIAAGSIQWQGQPSYLPNELGQGGLQSHLSDALGDNKRPRASAPSSRLMTEEPPLPAADDTLNFLPPDRRRQLLYHFESRGRHLPRGRTSHDIDGGVLQQLGLVYDPIDPEELMRMDETAFLVKDEGNSSHIPLLNNARLMRSNDGLPPPGESGSRSVHNQCEVEVGLPPWTFRLGSNGSNAHLSECDQVPIGGRLQPINLQLQGLSSFQGEGTGHATAGSSGRLGLGWLHQQAPGIAGQHGADGSTAVFTESDSFNREISRLLQHQDSDQYRRNMGTSLSPLGYGHPDPTGALMDLYLQEQQAEHGTLSKS